MLSPHRYCAGIIWHHVCTATISRSTCVFELWKIVNSISSVFILQIEYTSKSDRHQTSSVIPLVTGDKVIKFWKVKVKVGGRGMRSTEPF